jgi:hypothetical protein
MTTDTRTAEEIVYELLPLHGPYDRDRTVRAGYLIDELIRYLNYATTNAEAMPYPAGLYDLVGVLGAAAGKLPQVCQQSGHRLKQFATDPEFVNRSMDFYRTPEAAQAAHADAVVRAEQAHAELQHAGALARSLADQLATVQNLLSPLGLNTSFDDDDEDGED